MESMQGVAERLAGAIRIKTIACAEQEKMDGAKFRALHEYLKKSYPLAASKLSWEVVEEYSLLIKWQGGGGCRPIALLAHMDVVPVTPGTEDHWKHDAFQGFIDDAYMWGRGALDMKGHLVCVLEAVEGLLKEEHVPESDVYLCFGHNEELIDAPRSGAKALVLLLKERGVTLDLVVDEGGFVLPGKALLGTEGYAAVVGTAEKGYMDVRLTCAQEGGHSSQPPATTAIGILAKALLRLESNPFPLKLIGTVEKMLRTAGAQMGGAKRFLFANLWLFKPLILKTLSKKPITNAFVRTTCAATMASGSPAPNVLPQKAEFTVNMRLLPGDTVESALERVRRVIGDSRVSVELIQGRNASGESPTDTDGYRLIQSTLEALYPGVLVLPYLMIAGTDSCRYEPICRNIYRIAPFQISQDELKGAHGTNECISIENLGRGIQFFRSVIKDYWSAAKQENELPTRP